MRINGLQLPRTTLNTPLKIYCDATRREPEGHSAAGWVLCDHNGHVLETSGCELGKMTSVQAECSAVKRIVAALSGYDQVQHVKVYSDCRPAVGKLSESRLFHDLEYGTVEWMERGKNEVADMVADHYLYIRGGTPPKPTPYGSDEVEYGDEELDKDLDRLLDEDQKT